MKNGIWLFDDWFIRCSTFQKKTGLKYNNITFESRIEKFEMLDGGECFSTE